MGRQLYISSIDVCMLLRRPENAVDVLIEGGWTLQRRSCHIQGGLQGAQHEVCCYQHVFLFELKPLCRLLDAWEAGVSHLLTSASVQRTLYQADIFALSLLVVLVLEDHVSSDSRSSNEVMTRTLTLWARWASALNAKFLVPIGNWSIRYGIYSQIVCCTFWLEAVIDLSWCLHARQLTQLLLQVYSGFLYRSFV